MIRRYVIVTGTDQTALQVRTGPSYRTCDGTTTIDTLENEDHFLLLLNNLIQLSNLLISMEILSNYDKKQN